MSENLDLVRSIFAEWERGDFSSAEWADPQIEFVMVGGDTPGTWSGLSGMAEGFLNWLRTWEDFRVEADEYRALDLERVLVLLHVSGRGKMSGLHLEDVRPSGANLFHIREGRVTRLVLDWETDHLLGNAKLVE